MSSAWFLRRVWVVVSSGAFGLVLCPGSRAQALGTESVVGISIADVAAVASLVVVVCIAALVLMWRRGVGIAGERDVLGDAFCNARDSQLVTRADGGVVAASAGWCDIAGYDSDAPLAHLANGTFIAADGEMDRLRRLAAGGDGAVTLLRSAERGGDWAVVYDDRVLRRRDPSEVGVHALLAELSDERVVGAFLKDVHACVPPCHSGPAKFYTRGAGCDGSLGF